MQIQLKQGVFRFLILSHVNELLINKELIINAIKKAAISPNTPRTTEEVEGGAVAATEPYILKNLEQILRDLNAFSLSGGDNKRRASSNSTEIEEISVENDEASISTKEFMLESAWGFIAKDASGVELTSALEESFNSYITVVREIASWVMYLSKEQDSTTVSMGGSSLSTLLRKWGPVGLDEDLDDFYCQLYEHVYHFSLKGMVSALLESKPVGITIKTYTKNDLKFDGEGYADIKLPLQDGTGSLPVCKYYITKVNYITADGDCGVPEIETNLDYEECAESFSLQLVSIDGGPICKTENRTQPVPFDPPMLDPPPRIIPPITPPVPHTDTPRGGDPVAVMYVVDCGTSSDLIMTGGHKAIDCWTTNVWRTTADAGVTKSDMAGYASYTN